jgi:hypothetical protein
MKCLARCVALLLLGTALGAQAASDPNNPYNSPIRRANPNSLQGTAPATPGLAPQVNLRPPTLENGGIGNGNNLRRELSKPNLDPQRPPRSSDRTP